MIVDDDTALDMTGLDATVSDIWADAALGATQAYLRSGSGAL